MTSTANPLHTPGPWHWVGHDLRPVSPETDVTIVLSVEDFGWVRCGCNLDAVDVELRHDKALIAAAPQILDAARAAEAVLARQGWLRSSPDPEAVALYKLRDAIAAAITPEEE